MKALSNSPECPKCGSQHKSKPFCLYENGWYCFSCGYTKAADRSFSFHNRRIESPDWPDAISSYNDFPLSIKKWLLQYHIGGELCRKHNILSTEDESVIYVNLDEDNNVLFYQQRWPLKEQRAIQTKGSKCLNTFKTNRNTPIVLCEDFLSYVRIAEVCDVSCLWGTKIGLFHLKPLCQEYDTIITWLDNDQEKEINSGQVAADKIKEDVEYLFNKQRYYRGFSAQKKKYINIVTELDPKWYTTSEIESIIKEHL